MIHQPQLLMPLGAAANFIIDGDILLYRKDKLLSKLIKGIGHSKYSHAAIVGWGTRAGVDAVRELQVYEMVGTGGKVSPLAEHCKKWPGQIDVFRLPDGITLCLWDTIIRGQFTKTYVYDRAKAIRIMTQLCKKPYGFWHLLATYLVNAPIIRLFVTQPTNDDLTCWKHPPHCSEAVAFAVRKAFIDLVRETPDSYTQPGDLARSPLLRYMFTLAE